MKLTLIICMLSMFLLSGAILIEQNDDQPEEVDIVGLLKLASIKRTIDGSGNNLKHSDWGKSYTNIARRTPARYEDGKS
jgi:hypothetical protein